MAMFVCLYVCLLLLYWNPKCWMDCNEIWHRGDPWGREGSSGGFGQVPKMGVCVLFIEIQTAGQIWMKLGMEVVLKGGEGFWRSFSLLPTTPLVLGPKRGCLWSLSYAFCQKLYQTKVAGCPQVSGGGSHPYRGNFRPVWSMLSNFT